MNKVYLLLSLFIFVLIVIMNYSPSEVQSYIAGDMMLKIYCEPDGTIIKREYYNNGVITRSLEYKDGEVKLEKIYDEEGRKVKVNHLENNEVVKTTYYRNGFIPMLIGDPKIEVVLI